jgi:site-specific recombinase XerD
MITLSLSQAIQGYLLDAGARRLSPNTIKFYQHIFNRLARFLGDPAIGAIAKADLQRFMASLAHLSKKTALGHHAGLSALWRWALSEGLVERNWVRDIQAPVPETRVIIPFTEAEVKALLAAVDKSAPYARPGQRECRHSNPSAQRNRVIIYLLLDTGIRASELCGLRVRNIDLKARHVTVMGKGSKERTIYFSEATGKLLWRYVAQRGAETVDAWLFPAWRAATPLDARDLYHILHRIGQRAGVADVYPHRFRHTFAIQYLRNHGDVYTLQAVLGHTTLDMVRRYLAIAQTDIQAAHRLASPVANWRL